MSDEITAMVESAIGKLAFKINAEGISINHGSIATGVFDIVMSYLDEREESARNVIGKMEKEETAGSRPYDEYIKIIEDAEAIRNTMKRGPNARLLEAVQGINRESGRFLRIAEDTKVEELRGMIRDEIIDEIRRGWPK